MTSILIQQREGKKKKKSKRKKGEIPIDRTEVCKVDHFKLPGYPKRWQEMHNAGPELVSD
jgi:hypothetical protein